MDSPLSKTADIRQHWDAIREGVAKALEGDDERPEDVYAACVNGTASLHMAPDAALVLSLRDTQLRVWVAVSWGEPGAIARYEDDLIAIARSAGARRVEFATRRPGFERVLPDGWHFDYAIYSKEI